MKNKELKKISKDLWYKLIDLDENYFIKHFMEWNPDGYYHRDHLLHQAHNRNFSDPLAPLDGSIPLFNVLTFPVNILPRLKYDQFTSTSHFGYLPNFNRYPMSNFVGDMFLYEDVEKRINKLEGIIAPLSTNITHKNLSPDEIKVFADMFAVQKTFRNFRVNNLFDNTINDIYQNIGNKITDDLLNVCLKPISQFVLRHNKVNDDSILNICDFSKKKNEFKVKELNEYYELHKQQLSEFTCGHLIDLNDNLLITSDAYGYHHRYSNIIYIPISPSKMILLSTYPVRTSNFDLDLIPIINGGLIEYMGLFALWGTHYKPSIYLK